MIAIVGDGAFTMNGMNEMITVKRYWESHFRENPTLIFVVFNNEDLNQVTWEQRVLSGDPKFEGSQRIPNFEYAKYAELVGLKGLYCDSDSEIGEIWAEALKADRPVVLEVKVDNETPPLPPHIKLEQAQEMAMAIAKGDPEAKGIMKKSAAGKWQEIKESLPGRGD